MKKFLLMAALAIVPVLAFAVPALADSPGQLSNGPMNYKVRNVTQNGAYAQSITAACNDTVKYSITLSNSDFGLLSNLTVKAALASGAISASATNAAGATTSVSGNATVSLAKGNLSYVPGSTVRITSDGATSTPLSDGIATSGVNAGNLNGSTAIFVQFQAKVDCPTTPPEMCTVPGKENLPKNSPLCVVTPTTPTTPTVLPETGAVENVLAVVGLGALVASIAYFVTSRRNVLG
ncbi:MAG: hypothetical protein JWM00_644 [Candidatus Saccharibacteria bacterium]|nr:hypothetical protein [Candidatus Saccharibacteria bacterium]